MEEIEAEEEEQGSMTVMSAKENRVETALVAGIIQGVVQTHIHHYQESTGEAQNHALGLVLQYGRRIGGVIGNVPDVLAHDPGHQFLVEEDATLIQSLHLLQTPIQVTVINTERREKKSIENGVKAETEKGRKKRRRRKRKRVQSLHSGVNMVL